MPTKQLILLTLATLWLAQGMGGFCAAQEFEPPPLVLQNKNNQTHDVAIDLPPIMNIEDRFSRQRSQVVYFEEVVGQKDIRLTQQFQQTLQLQKTQQDDSDNQLLPFDLPPIKPETQPKQQGYHRYQSQGHQQISLDAWWAQQVNHPLNENARQDKITPELLILTALRHSPRIRAISQEPLIREALITEANAEFDADLFVRTQFDDRTDPVGNTLTTGGAPFLKDNIWNGSAGFRRKLLTGGEIEVSQEFGFQNSNSRFFVPQDQGTATLALNYTQPLLRGAGQYYNRSQILIAQTSHGIAWDEYATNLQDELNKVVESYWTVYHRRCVLIQKRNNVQRGEAILRKLEGRKSLDSLPSQIARARAAVQLRQTELANAYRDVFNAETEIRRLIGMPQRGDEHAVELVPVEYPNHSYQKHSLYNTVALALDNRPEIKKAMRRAKIASTQYDIAKHEVMPQLSLLMNTYVSALDGGTGIARAFQSQFDGSTPGVGMGLEFEVPYQNRAARSRRLQRHLQLIKIKNEVDQTAQLVIADAQIALRRLDSAYQTMASSTAAIKAARADLEQQTRRWESFALVEGDISEGQTPALLLDQLLDAQQRLTDAELTFVGAELEFKLAEIGLKKATGQLLKCEQISFERRCDDQLPQIDLQKNTNMQSQQDPGWFEDRKRTYTPATTSSVIPEMLKKLESQNADNSEAIRRN